MVPFSLPTIMLLPLGLACFVLYGVVRLVTVRRSHRDLPKPPYSFLFGHLGLFGDVVKQFPPNSHPHAFYTTLAQKYNLPGIFYIDLWPLGPQKVVVIDPDAAAQFTQVRSYPKHKIIKDFIDPISGPQNIVSENGAQWKNIHRLLAPAFTSAHVKNLVGVVADETIIFREHLSRLAESGEAFSMETVGARLVFDVIGKATFNFPLNAQTTGSLCLTGIKTVVDCSVKERSFNPLVKFQAALKRRSALASVRRYIMSQIQERYDVLKQENTLRNKKDAPSILDLVLYDQLHASPDAADKKLAGLEPEFLEVATTNIMVLLLGGHGTTTDTLCFLFMLLSAHPKVLERLREEHDRMFNRDVAQTITVLKENPHKINELEYTTAVIKETLRMFPIGFTVRAAEKGASFSYKGQTLPIDNRLICIAQHTMHYNPAIYPSPEKFEPERFLEPGNVPRNAWRAFERGPRACLGQEVAIDEMRVILLLTVRDFDFGCVGVKPNPTPRTSYTDLDLRLGDLVFQDLGFEAKPRDGMMMKVSRRGHGKLE